MYYEGEGGDSMAVQPPATVFFLEGHGKSKMKILRLKDEQRRKMWHAV